jgi:hypothetical protein
MPKELLGAKDAGALLGLKENQVAKLARDGDLPGTLVGKSWVFDLRDVRMLARRRQTEAAAGGKRGRGRPVKVPPAGEAGG